MKTIHAAIVAASALAMLLLAPLHLVARAHAAHAHGAHAFHFSNHFRATRHHHDHGTFGGWPFYGGIETIPPYAAENVMTYAQPAAVVYVPEPQLSLGCHHSRETVTVPAEAGGTRQITVTRC